MHPVGDHRGFEKQQEGSDCLQSSCLQPWRSAAKPQKRTSKYQVLNLENNTLRGEARFLPGDRTSLCTGNTSFLSSFWVTAHLETAFKGAMHQLHRGSIPGK